ncbi:MAG: bifunctional phosphoribosylaminoimidazolecarboxamide formyltransferase/IMP cyclohydrolase [Myxococcota bacterium]
MRALLSVHDKTGLVDFAHGLIGLGYELVASGGTARALVEGGLPVTPVEAVTGFPELLGGRVKTLHPAIHAGILSRRTDADTHELAERGLQAIDLVAVSLYPFEQALARGEAEPGLIEEIDIGGVALLRAAAKSFPHVLVVSSPEQYKPVLDVLTDAAGDVAGLRRKLAAEAFAHTAAYDAAIGSWLGGQTIVPGYAPAGSLRYGENPHQEAAFLGPRGATPYRQHGGKELSYNNILDLDAAWNAIREFPQPGLCIVKHGSPCGLAVGESLLECWRAGLASDPVSAFGGVVAANRTIESDVAEAMDELFVEVVAAPGFSLAAIAHFAGKKKNCRVLAMDPSAAVPRTVRTAIGGLLVQDADSAAPEPSAWRHVAGPAPDAATLAALGFAFHVVKHVKSNAIVLVQPTATGMATVGIGGGQTNRIDAVQQAITRAGERARGAALASDAFFPFPDGVRAAAAAGIGAVVQPGGAMRDAEVIAAADELGVTMMFSGRRHFRH